MNNIARNIFLLSGLFLLLQSCTSQEKNEPVSITIEAESFKESSVTVKLINLAEGNKAVTRLDKGEWLGFEVSVPLAGRYRCEVRVSSESNTVSSCWIEDYYDNKDGRTYNITAAIPLPANRKGGVYSVVSRDGCPLNSGKHKLKLHVEGDSVSVDWIKFVLLKKHQLSADTLIQNMEGKEWRKVWSDEFDGNGLVDSAKWTYDTGNWGWGNNESQYYTEKRTENARQEGGNLIIEARKNDLQQPWTSARLTTRGKVSFVYGKIEFRAKVPAGDGTWAAGWTLGDSYRDEISWPYCGEIDILEAVGHEIDDESHDGINHASCHTRAYYFKQGNHITNVIAVKDMASEFHTYGVEWTKDAVIAYVDGEKYYTYDKHDSEWAWPFDQPQNLIINLAMGGGMGGTINPSLSSQKLIVDYVRVYDKK